MTMTHDPRSIREEGPWLALELDELVIARQRAMDAGHSRRTADGFHGWLVAKRLNERDTTAASTRARYRAILRQIGPPPAGTARRRREAGRARISAVAAVAGAGALAAVTGHPAALALAPIILEPSVTSSCDDDELDELPAAA